MRAGGKVADMSIDFGAIHDVTIMSRDSKDKRRVSELWAERSGGRCLFVMPKGKDGKAITAVIGTSTTHSVAKEQDLL
jgi:hypothetical protein